MYRATQKNCTRTFCSALALVACAALNAPHFTSAHDGHHHAAATSKSSDIVRSERSYSIPDVVLVDLNAKPVRLRQLLGGDEPVMLNFIFTTCTAICPVMSSIFSKVPPELGAAGGKIRMISISIDPENDTPKELRAYADKFDAGPQWQFLTGSVENIAIVQRAFDNYRSDKMSHDPLTFLRKGGPGASWIRIEGFASSKDLAREYQNIAAK